jgi:hypothetical protein
MAQANIKHLIHENHRQFVVAALEVTAEAKGGEAEGFMVVFVKILILYSEIALFIGV